MNERYNIIRTRIHTIFRAFVVCSHIFERIVMHFTYFTLLLNWLSRFSSVSCWWLTSQYIDRLSLIVILFFGICSEYWPIPKRNIQNILHFAAENCRVTLTCFQKLSWIVRSALNRDRQTCFITVFMICEHSVIIFCMWGCCRSSASFVSSFSIISNRRSIWSTILAQRLVIWSLRRLVPSGSCLAGRCLLKI